MFGDYRDNFPPGSIVRMRPGYGGEDFGEGIVADIEDFAFGGQEKIKDSVHLNYVFVKWEKGGYSQGNFVFTEESLEIVRGGVSFTPLCNCKWNKHPLFCKCEVK